MLKYSLLFFLLSVVLCASTKAEGQGQNSNVDRGGEPPKKTEENFWDLFGGGGNQGQGQTQGQGQGQSQSKGQLIKLLVTKRLSDVFVGDSDNITGEFANILDATQKTILIAFKNLKCPNGTVVFNVTRLMLKEALGVAGLLSLDAPPSSNFFNLSGLHDSVRFPSVVCWNDTKQKLQEKLANFSDGQIKRAFSAKILAHLTNEAAKHLASVLPDRVHQLLCEQLVVADYLDMVVVAAVFSCDGALASAARNDTQLARAILEGKRNRGLGNLSDTEWDEMIKNYGHAMPHDFIKAAPRQKVKDMFVKIWDKKNADALVGAVDFSTVNETFVQSLGPVACQLPASALLKIPTPSLEKGKKSLACIKEETNKAKKRALADKMLGTRSAANCKDFLMDVDATDEKCWKLMSTVDLQSINFTDFDHAELQQLSGPTINTLRSKLQLGNVSKWSEATWQTYSWTLKTVGGVAMNADDVKNVTDAIVMGKLKAADLDLLASAARKIFNATKGRLVNAQGKLNATTVKTLGSTVEAMSSEDVAELLTPEVVDAVLPEMQDQFGKMGKAPRRALLHKLNLGQLKKRLCELRPPLSEDVDGEQLANMTGLYDELFMPGTCDFQCHGLEQCSAVFRNFVEAQLMNGEWNTTADFLDWLSSSGVICGLKVETIIELQPELTLMDVAAAYFNADCKNPKAARTLYEKLKLFLQLYNHTELTDADVELLGGNFVKHMSAGDLEDYSEGTKRNILRSMGKADLYDVSSKWVKGMAASALSELGANTGDINEVTMLTLGSLACGLTANDVQRMTKEALTDALPKLVECPDINVNVLKSAVQAYRQKMSKSANNMSSSDLIMAGIAALADCAGADVIPDEAKADAVGDLAEAFKQWKKTREMRNKQWNDKASDDEKTQNETENALRCTLRKMVEARIRTRTNSQNRTKRATGSFTCDDIRLLGEEADILTASDISGLSDVDFTECTEVLGAVQVWTQEQKNALAAKAKQAWGAVTTWTQDAIRSAGTILQGLTTQELNSSALTLEHIEPLGQLRGWAEEQLKTVFSYWLSSDTNVSQGITSITGGQLMQLGYFICGATPTQINQVTVAAFRDAMRDIGDAATHCSMEVLQAWTAKAQQTLGPVTNWTVSQTAAVDRLLAGLSGSDLAKLSSSQLSVMDLETFALITPEKFANFTPEQLQSLSMPQAMSITDNQLSKLNASQKEALKTFGITIKSNTSSSANVLTLTLGSLVTMATTAIFLIFR